MEHHFKKLRGMRKLDYNEWKLAVFLVMRDLEEATAYRVWQEMEDDASLRAIRMSLLRLHRQGLLNRWGYPKTYEITEKGIERIDWLEEEEDEEEDDREEYVSFTL